MYYDLCIHVLCCYTLRKTRTSTTKCYTFDVTRTTNQFNEKCSVHSCCTLSSGLKKKGQRVLRVIAPGLLGRFFFGTIDKVDISLEIIRGNKSVALSDYSLE